MSTKYCDASLKSFCLFRWNGWNPRGKIPPSAVIQLVRKSLRQTASFLKTPPGRLASVLWDNSMTSVGSSVALEARLEAGRSTACSTLFALLGKDQGDWGATDRCFQGIPSVQATDLRTPRNDQPLGGGTSIETRRVGDPRSAGMLQASPGKPAGKDSRKENACPSDLRGPF